MSRVQCPRARTKAKPRYSSPTPPRERPRSLWYRRGEGAKVIRPAKGGAPEVGARAAWPSLAVLPPWFLAMLLLQ